jgi:hypothetical protein
MMFFPSLVIYAATNQHLAGLRASNPAIWIPWQIEPESEQVGTGCKTEHIPTYSFAILNDLQWRGQAVVDRLFDSRVLPKFVPVPQVWWTVAQKPGKYMYFDH